MFEVLLLFYFFVDLVNGIVKLIVLLWNLEFKSNWYNILSIVIRTKK